MATALVVATLGTRGKSAEPRHAPESMDWAVSFSPGPSAASTSTWRVPLDVKKELALPGMVKERWGKKPSSKSKKAPKKP